MTLPTAPPPLTLNDAKLDQIKFNELMVERYNALLSYAVQIAPEISPVLPSIGGGSFGSVVRVVNSIGLQPSEVVHLSSEGLFRASFTGRFATHVASSIEGGDVVLTSTAASVPVALDGQGSGTTIYLSLNGKASLQKPPVSGSGNAWEQVLGTRIGGGISGPVLAAINLPASVPIRV